MIFAAVMFIVIIVCVVIAKSTKESRRKQDIEQLRQLILGCDKGKYPYERVEVFCQTNNFSNEEYQEIRKDLYYELAQTDDIHAIKMAAVYAHKNPDEEMLFLNRAAELGDVDSMYKLGLCYELKESYPNHYDLEKSFYWYHQAAAKGNVKAVVNVARAYARGEGVAKDREKAYGILRDYSDRGYDNCSCELAEDFYNNIADREHFNLSRAIETYERVIRRGEQEFYAKAASRLGYIFGGAYLFSAPTTEFSDRRKAAYCFALAHFADDDLYDVESIGNTGYRWSENEMSRWRDDAINLRYNPM